jgi:hypothetical protein
MNESAVTYSSAYVSEKMYSKFHHRFLQTSRIIEMFNKALKLSGSQNEIQLMKITHDYTQ